MMPLLGLLNKKTSDLTVDDLKQIRTALKIDTLELTDELKDAAVGLLAGHDIHTVADLIKSPESVQMITDFFQGKPSKSAQEAEALIEGQDAFVHQCRHCKQFEIIQL